MRNLSLFLMALFYIGAGTLHFVGPEFYLRIMPPWLPWHRELVFLSGVAEVLLGIFVLIPRTRKLAAWGIIALLIAVFPANIHMAINSDQFPQFSPTMLWLRLPLQFLMMLWAWRFTRCEWRPR